MSSAWPSPQITAVAHRIDFERSIIIPMVVFSCPIITICTFNFHFAERRQPSLIDCTPKGAVRTIPKIVHGLGFGCLGF